MTESSPNKPRRSRRRRRRPDRNNEANPDSKKSPGSGKDPSHAKAGSSLQEPGKRRPRRRRRQADARRPGAEKADNRSTGHKEAPRVKPPKAEPRDHTPLVGVTADIRSPASAEKVRWGDDTDAPTPDISLRPDLPKDVAANDPDPVSAQFEFLANETDYRDLDTTPVRNVVGVRFSSAGKIHLCDGQNATFCRGDTVIVDSDRGQRSGTVAVPNVRRSIADHLFKIVGGPIARDRHPGEEVSDKGQSERQYLQTAKALAKSMELPIKVFRASLEDDGRSLAVYYSCEEKTDVRRLTRALSKELSPRVSLRHAGARDEAKLIGGIGSCGQTLCCTTWLPAFVPVSIKNAKDQGLVLNPTKVSGQCGRLKCCLVYEQETYAEMKQGLPKLGKRVITNDGLEGRVVEVDVLHQRIRVSVGRGESKVYGKGEVQPMFASQPQGKKTQGKERTRAATTKEPSK